MLTPPVYTRKKTVRPLCSLTLSVICWVFVRASFPKNTKKTWKFIIDQRLYIYQALGFASWAAPTMTVNCAVSF